MKKVLCLCVALCLALLCSCGSKDNPSNSGSGNNPGTASTPGTQDPVTPGNQDTPDDANTPSDPSTPDNTDTPSTPIVQEGPTGMDFGSDVVALEGTWNLSQVYVDGEMKTPVDNAITFRVTKELDPSELVDGPAYIHNQVYNLTGYLTFGVEDIKNALAAEDVEEYKGSTSWEDFPQGKVVAEGEFYEQPGPATMRFKDIDDYGLYLDQIAGASADLDTTNKTLVLAMNGSGQLLLGYSEEHIERPGTSGEWVYCLIFDKAA